MVVSRRPRRGGMTLVECAIVYPVTLLLIMGIIISGLGVFRKEELGWLAREASRWAAVHGPTYQQEQSQSAPTSQTVLTNAVYPRLVALDKTKLTCTLSMASGNATVTLTYQWIPEGFFTPMTLTSTSAMPITY